jgi:hypothetical protein
MTPWIKTFSHVEQITPKDDLAEDLCTLSGEASTEEVPTVRRDLSDIVGTWHPDAEFDAAIADQRRVDESWIADNDD